MPGKPRTVARCPNNKTYRMGCKCEFCTAVSTQRQKKYVLQSLARERGEIFPTDPVDAELSTQLLRKGAKAKLTDRDMATLTGIRVESIRRIRLGKSKTVYRMTQQKIVKGLEHVDIAERHPSTLVDATWVKQMILCLCAQGYTLQHQRDILFNNLGVKGGFIRGRHNTTLTYYRHVKEMRWLLRAVGDSRGPAHSLAKRMQSRGIFPAKHYDINGQLLVKTLTHEQRRYIEGV